MPRPRLLIVTLLAFLALAALPLSVGATHSWGGYHWARTANPFTLQLGDNVSSAWDSYLRTTAGGEWETGNNDWSDSEVLNAVIVPGGTSPRKCQATEGRVEVCNDRYGFNGWLGVAGVWTSGGHITKGYVKLNDSYFNTATYNTPAWRNSVMCQEVGHTLGLGHNDEDFSTVNGTCMDYANDPTLNQYPNGHDYEMLASIYGHLDTTTTVKAMPAEVSNAAVDTPAQWGRLVRASGRTSIYMREFAGGYRIFTFVIRAE